MPALIGLLSVVATVGFFVSSMVLKNSGLGTMFMGMFVLSTVLFVVYKVTHRRPTVDVPTAGAETVSHPRFDVRQSALEEVLKLHPEMGHDLSPQGIQALNDAVEARMPEVDLRVRLEEIHTRERETQRVEEARKLARETVELERLCLEEAETKRRAHEAEKAKARQDYLASLSPRRRFITSHRVALLSAAIGAVLVIVIAGLATYNAWLKRTAEAEAILAEEQSRSELFSSCNPERVGEIPQDLRQSVLVKWASCASTEGKILLASASRSEDFDVLRTLAKDVEPLVRAAVAANVFIPTELSIALAGDPDPQVCGSVVAGVSPSEDPKGELSRNLASCGDWKQRVRVAYSAGSELANILAELAQDEEVKVRITVAENRATREPALSSLAADLDTRVRMAVARNPKNQPSVLAVLAGDGVEEVRAASLSTIAGSWGIPTESLSFLSKDPRVEVRVAVALNPTIEPTVLASLAADSAENVRIAVASNSKVDEATLMSLVYDSSTDVQIAITQNSQTSPSILVALANSSNETVQASLISAPASPDKLILEFCSAASRDIRQLALKRLRENWAGGGSAFLVQRCNTLIRAR